jgi:hypothetical protein
MESINLQLDIFDEHISFPTTAKKTGQRRKQDFSSMQLLFDIYGNAVNIRKHLRIRAKYSTLPHNLIVDKMF